MDIEEYWRAEHVARAVAAEGAPHDARRRFALVLTSLILAAIPALLVLAVSVAGAIGIAGPLLEGGPGEDLNFGYAFTSGALFFFIIVALAAAFPAISVLLALLFTAIAHIRGIPVAWRIVPWLMGAPLILIAFMLNLLIAGTLLQPEPFGTAVTPPFLADLLALLAYLLILILLSTCAALFPNLMAVRAARLRQYVQMEARPPSSKYKVVIPILVALSAVCAFAHLVITSMQPSLPAVTLPWLSVAITSLVWEILRRQALNPYGFLNRLGRGVESWGASGFTIVAVLVAYCLALAPFLGRSVLLPAGAEVMILTPLLLALLLLPMVLIPLTLMASDSYLMRIRAERIHRRSIGLF